MAVVDGEPIGERNAPMGPRRTAVVLRRVATIAALALIPACGAPPPAAVPAPFGRVLGLEAEARLWVEQTLESLTLEELVGQLVIEWIPGGYVSPSRPDFEPLDLKAGGVELRDGRLGRGGQDWWRISLDRHSSCLCGQAKRATG